jgi:hypothetical protein
MLVFDPNDDCWRDVATLEERERQPGEEIIEEWLGNLDLPGFFVTRETLMRLHGSR